MELILHIGSHKTGTTSIQASLSANRSWLYRNGYNYPHLCGPKNSHNEFAHQIAMGSPEHIDALRQELVSKCSGEKTTVISSEELSVRIVGDRSWRGFDCLNYWPRRLEYLQRLSYIFQDFKKIRVYFCLRPGDDYAESLYATKILSRESGFHGSFEDFLIKMQPIFEYKKHIDYIERIFRDINLIAFDEISDNLIENFYQWTGIPTPPEKTESKNVTPDKRMIFWFSEVNKYYDKSNSIIKMQKIFLKSSQHSLSPKEKQKLTFWSDMARKKKLRQMSEYGLPENFFRHAIYSDFVYAGLSAPEIKEISDKFELWQKQKKKSIVGIVRYFFQN